MKTLYIHVGTPKTGTSAIQSFLLDNQEVLEQKGYCYRLMPFAYQGKASRRRNAHFALEKVTNEVGEVDRDATLKMVENGYQAVAQWLAENENVVLTDESYWRYLRGENWKILERLIEIAKKNQAQVKIIVYLRRQDEFVVSLWKQNVREGRVMESCSSYLDNKSNRKVLNYAKRLQEFESYVGKENLIVRKYERGSFLGKTGTIFSDFLDALGLEWTDEFVIQKEVVNESIGDNYVEILRVLNQLVTEGGGFDRYASDFFGQNAVMCSRTGQQENRYSMFSQEEQKAVWKKYEKSNESVKKAYFPKDQELFTDTLTSHPRWTKDNPQMQEDIVLYFGTMLLQQQREHMQFQKDVQERLQDQEEQIKQLQTIIKQNKGELKALKIFLKPIKWIWWKINKVKTMLFGKEKTT